MSVTRRAKVSRAVTDKLADRVGKRVGLSGPRRRVRRVGLRSFWRPDPVPEVPVERLDLVACGGAGIRHQRVPLSDDLDRRMIFAAPGQQAHQFAASRRLQSVKRNVQAKIVFGLLESAVVLSVFNERLQRPLAGLTALLTLFPDPRFVTASQQVAAIESDGLT